MIRKEDQAHWIENGWLAFDSLISPARQRQLSLWINEISLSPHGGECRLHYHEATDAGPRLCRTERFLEDHEDLRRLITGPELTGIAAELLGEPAVLYKEKVNYKHPGGAGYAAHQDATAYAFVEHHVTCLIAIDPMTPDNGCLEFASGGHGRLLDADERGCIRPGIAEALIWQTVSLAAGGVVFFSSLAPHRSAPNRSDRSRRAIYLTYNARSQGDMRASYYEARDREMAETAAAGAAQLRISTIGHFRGLPPNPEAKP